MYRFFSNIQKNLKLFSKTTHLEKCVRGVLLKEGAAGPLPPGSSCGHLRFYVGQRIKPNRDGAPPGQQALQLLKVSVAASTLYDRDTHKKRSRGNLGQEMS